jgi:hypothetical protein
MGLAELSLDFVAPLRRTVIPPGRLVMISLFAAVLVEQAREEDRDPGRVADTGGDGKRALMARSLARPIAAPPSTELTTTTTLAIVKRNDQRL